MKAFITGSQAYGMPTKASDVDLVIRADESTAVKLKELLEGEEAKSGGASSSSIRLGKLNLIVAHTDEAFEAWLVGTIGLVKVKPVERTVAVGVFQRLFGAL